ncbi:ROK family transcriptional regulator [Paenibacillus endoradicis]|uniref:ROK family transcriptional regulator n=1 Tax=Paenibacillus endoradicis TaxID=2972487 RepID=UPI002159A20A|nr:ROK family protein [Paenibacillus endoradicis]MCR8659557.1 ROK family protein [Paenibacillus endoradicis]
MNAKSTGDLALVKKLNSYIVLSCIRKYAPLSRAQVSEQTGLNKATVSNLVTELIEHNLVIEIGPGESSGGRKPVLLLFNDKAGYAIGVDLGVNYIRGNLVELNGSIVKEYYQKLSNQKRELAFDALVQCIDSLLKQAPESTYGIVGIGVGVPGIVDQNGTILFAPNMKWREVPLKQMLEERFDFPIIIDNEANAGAQGEQKYGAGKGIRNQIYLSVGYGIGSGIILDKELYKGTSGFSGELGHLSIDFNGKECTCGNLGCWELYASEKALLEDAAAYGFENLDDLIHAAENGDERVLQLFEKIGFYLGVGIANIINTLNPDSVMIGNRMSRAAEWIMPSIEKTVQKRALSFQTEQLQFLFAELQEQSAVRGAAYYAIDRFFEQFKAMH